MKVNEDPETRLATISGIKSGIIEEYYDEKHGEKRFKEIIFDSFPKGKKSKYTVLKNTRGTKNEPLAILEVRQIANNKKHIYIRFNTLLKFHLKKELEYQIKVHKEKDNGEIIPIIKTVGIGLPKAAARALRDELINILKPKITTITENPKRRNVKIEKILNILETEKFAFGVVRMLLEKGEITINDVMSRFKVSKPTGIKHLKKLEEGDIIVSDLTSHNKSIYMLKVDIEELKNIIKEHYT